MKKISWLTVGVLSILIGLYPILYFLFDGNFGILGSKTVELLNNSLWNLGFFGHIVLGGVAVLVGWLQFNNKLRQKKPKIHRIIGRVYVISALISGTCAIYISFYATGGIIAKLGFFFLGITWLSTTILGYKTIKKGKVVLHEKFMIFSFAACFAAVVLRIWLPILTIIFDDFIIAYRIVAWLCWIPNIIIAYFIVQSKKSTYKVKDA